MSIPPPRRAARPGISTRAAEGVVRSSAFRDERARRNTNSDFRTEITHGRLTAPPFSSPLRSTPRSASDPDSSSRILLHHRVLVPSEERQRLSIPTLLCGSRVSVKNRSGESRAARTPDRRRRRQRHVTRAHRPPPVAPGYTGDPPQPRPPPPPRATRRGGRRRGGRIASPPPEAARSADGRKSARRGSHRPRAHRPSSRGPRPAAAAAAASSAARSISSLLVSSASERASPAARPRRVRARSRRVRHLRAKRSLASLQSVRARVQTRAFRVCSFRVVFFGVFQRSRVGDESRFGLLDDFDAAPNLRLGGDFLLPNRVPRLATSFVLRVERFALALSRARSSSGASRRERASPRRFPPPSARLSSPSRSASATSRGDGRLSRANRLRLGGFLGGYRDESVELARADGDRLEFGARVGFQRANLVSRRA